MAKGEVVEGQYLKIYKATSAFLVQIVGMAIFVILIQWFKGWLFGWLFDLTGWTLMQTLAEGKLLLGIMLLLLVIWGIYLWLRWRNTYYEIYPDRIVIRKGVIARRRIEVEMGELVSIRVEQGIMGRFLNYGNLRFAQGAVGMVGRTMYQIPSPEYYLDLVNSMLKRASKPEPATGTAVAGEVRVGTEAANGPMV